MNFGVRDCGETRYGILPLEAPTRGALSYGCELRTMLGRERRQTQAITAILIVLVPALKQMVLLRYYATRSTPQGHARSRAV